MDCTEGLFLIENCVFTHNELTDTSTGAQLEGYDIYLAGEVENKPVKHVEIYNSYTYPCRDKSAVPAVLKEELCFYAGAEPAVFVRSNGQGKDKSCRKEDKTACNSL